MAPFGINKNDDHEFPCVGSSVMFRMMRASHLIIPTHV